MFVSVLTVGAARCLGRSAWSYSIWHFYCIWIIGSEREIGHRGLTWHFSNTFSHTVWKGKKNSSQWCSAPISRLCDVLFATKEMQPNWFKKNYSAGNHEPVFVSVKGFIHVWVQETSSCLIGCQTNKPCCTVPETRPSFNNHRTDHSLSMDLSVIVTLPVCNPQHSDCCQVRSGYRSGCMLEKQNNFFYLKIKQNKTFFLLLISRCNSI